MREFYPRKERKGFFAKIAKGYIRKELFGFYSRKDRKGFFRKDCKGLYTQRAFFLSFIQAKGAKVFFAKIAKGYLRKGLFMW